MRRRLASVGLRGRIAAWTIAVIVLCLGIAFIAVYRDTGSQLRSQIDAEITGDSNDFAQALTASGALTPAKLSAIATTYVRSRPFSSSSTLMFATLAGSGTATN